MEINNRCRMEKERKVVFRHRETQPFGGKPEDEVTLHVLDVYREDVDVLQNDGNWEHGMRCEKVDSVVIRFPKTRGLEETIESVEELLVELKEAKGVKIEREHLSKKISDPSGWLNVEFKCPRCGGNAFGTSNCMSESTGHCNTWMNDGSRCTYTWKRPEEDGLVFVNKQ